MLISFQSLFHKWNILCIKYRYFQSLGQKRKLHSMIFSPLTGNWKDSWEVYSRSTSWWIKLSLNFTPALKVTVNRPVHVLLSRFYLDFILILYWFYLNFIQVKSGWNLDKLFFQLYPYFIKILYRFFQKLGQNLNKRTWMTLKNCDFKSWR